MLDSYGARQEKAVTTNYWSKSCYCFFVYIPPFYMSDKMKAVNNQGFGMDNEISEKSI